MRAIVASLLLLVLPAAASAIHGGAPVPAARGEAVVRIRWATARQSGDCSGVLITSKAVLTAAHCVRSPGATYRIQSVQIGNPLGRTTRAAVASVQVQPGYDPRRPELGSDLAVLVLQRAVTGHTPIAIAGAADDPRQQGQRLTISGFGITSERGRVVRTQALREVSLEYLSPFHCFSGPVAKMARTRLCAASPKAGVCPGDSGGPATLRSGEREVVVGIVSLAIAQKQCVVTAATLIRVSAFADWITSVAR